MATDIGMLVTNLHLHEAISSELLHTVMLLSQTFTVLCTDRNLLSTKPNRPGSRKCCDGAIERLTIQGPL
jgi:hypothetical protein